MGQNVSEACTTTKNGVADCAKTTSERTMLPFVRPEAQDRPAGQLPVEDMRYITANGEAPNAPQGGMGQYNLPPFRSSLDGLSALPMPPSDQFSQSQQDSSKGQSPAPKESPAAGIGLTPPSAARQQIQFGDNAQTTMATTTAALRREPEVRSDDWEEVNDSRRHISPRPDLNTASVQNESPTRHKLVPPSGSDAAKSMGSGSKDEELENRASTEAAKQCYFDLELGEAGPNTGHDISHGRERKWHRFRSGATYDGEWLGGVRDGVGKQCWLDGTVYVGQWRRGRAGGRGEIRHYDGDIYTGEWINGRAHGSGVFRHQGSHAIYEGEFRNDMREGMGVELWVDGSWYAGEFRKGAKHGHGEHRWPMPSGTYYVGSWRANELMGPGRYFVKDGPSYQGQWMNSVIDGAGVYTWMDGQQFEGQYQLDRKHGFGILTTPDGESKEGFWFHGKTAEVDPNN